MKKIVAGCVVEFVNNLDNQKLHEEQPDFYPAVGTLGTVVSTSLDASALVHWNDKETNGDHAWHVSMWRLRLQED